jgi:hypothetical protein
MIHHTDIIREVGGGATITFMGTGVPPWSFRYQLISGKLAGPGFIS